MYEAYCPLICDVIIILNISTCTCSFKKLIICSLNRRFWVMLVFLVQLYQIKYSVIAPLYFVPFKRNRGLLFDHQVSQRLRSTHGTKVKNVKYEWDTKINSSEEMQQVSKIRTWTRSKVKVTAWYSFEGFVTSIVHVKINAIQTNQTSEGMIKINYVSLSSMLQKKIWSILFHFKQD